MPELPEVETIVRGLQAADLYGLTIDEALIFWPKTLNGENSQTFRAKISGQKILNIVRLGKWLLFHLSQHDLYVHLRMTGKFFLGKKDDKMSSHERVRLKLSDGRTLKFEDQRKFGRWLLLQKQDRLSGVGIEPLSDLFTIETFKALVHNRKQGIKAFLLNQKFIAGLGNIYVDEALWEACIHPKRTAASLSDQDKQALFKAIPHVLLKGIRNCGTTLGSTASNYYSLSGNKGGNQETLNVFRCQKKPCPRCGTTIIKMVVAQRGTHICPVCQKLS